MARYTAVTWGVAVFVLLQAPGARAQDREQLQLIAEVRMLQEQMARLEATVNRLAERVDRSEQRLDESAGNASKASADHALALGEQGQAIGEIRLRLDATAAEGTRVSQDVAALGSGIRRILDRVNEITARLPAPETPVANDGTAAAPPPPLAPLVLAPSATALHDGAQADLLSGRYDLAIEGFRELLASFPNAPDAPNAQFAIGEAFARSGRCAEAVPEYRKVISNHGASDRVPDAYFMLGTCLRTVGDTAEADRMFATLIERFPTSPAAARARSGN